ncbi:hypothetical protein CLV59_101375 [Chitinophaga dinghuensis]|uniref:DUF5723 domain-containing protein n=1 Tax=Chitinophaga dinghuensis TaxID=1539050 RepID=A0A327WIM0_9BACT|nr:hypothetical protein [Chitinophaga dinghuensis]RAJ87614.1 hypothetical protein CLV59_101375 [Chitinophaga dinghuensis]
MKRILYLASLALLPAWASAQQIDLANLHNMFGKGKPLKVNGGVSANTIFSSGNARSPFAWYLNGSLNLNILGQVNLPFSFNLTNAGAGYSYPTLPNRLSLHPTYKGITAHIGDVAMSWSPYTLSGHQFTGVGVDVATSKEWTISAMYGRLRREVEYDSLMPNQTPNYKRTAWGVKMGLNKETYSLTGIVFKGEDHLFSLPHNLDSLHIYPETNLVIGLIGAVRPIKNLELSFDYTNSGVQLDSRDPNMGSKIDGGMNLMSYLYHQSVRTVFFKAVKAQMNYSVKGSTLGIGYERIDPGYQTMGAYFFNNDLENITINLSQPFLRGKANFSANVGYQRDDLDHTKSGSTSRMVGSMTMTYAPNERLNTSLNYSNFQSFMHIKPQFDYINQVSPIQNFDTLNFKQISQNANLNLNYMIGANTKRRSHNINLNLSFQDAADIQNDVLRKGNGSQFYNLSSAYSLMLVPIQTSITAAFNLSYNTIGRNDFMTLGPTLGANTKFFKKKMNAGMSLSYNSSNSGEGAQGQVMNVRLNSGYTFLVRHRLQFTAMQQTRWAPAKPAAKDVTGTLGYNYSF